MLKQLLLLAKPGINTTAGRLSPGDPLHADHAAKTDLFALVGKIAIVNGFVIAAPVLFFFFDLAFEIDRYRIHPQATRSESGGGGPFQNRPYQVFLGTLNRFRERSVNCVFGEQDDIFGQPQAPFFEFVG
jgi:hypothetical protein